MHCPFCTDSEVKSRTIIESDLAFAFPTNTPIVPGHILIIPKRHEAKYENLTNEEKASIEHLRIKMIHALNKVFGGEGFNFAWNDGGLAGQSAPHFHLHVVPRKEGDAGIYKYEPREFLYRPGPRTVTTPNEELLEIVELIKRNLR